MTPCEGLSSNTGAVGDAATFSTTAFTVLTIPRENTNIMAASVEDFELDKSFKYPKLYENEEKVFKQRINQMYQDKIKRGIIKNDPRYVKQIREEMRVFKKIGMVGFMLFMSELICWCWDNGIPIGPCRGSVGGSVIAYITDIIDVDPIVWNTVFSRFCNEHITEIGDIDIDIALISSDIGHSDIFSPVFFSLCNEHTHD